MAKPRCSNSTSASSSLSSSSSFQDDNSVSDCSTNNIKNNKNESLSHHHEYASHNKRQKREEKKRVVPPPLDSNELCRLHGLHTWGDCFLNPYGRNYRVYVNGNPMIFFNNNESTSNTASYCCRPTTPSSFVSSSSNNKEKQPQPQPQLQPQQDDDRLEKQHPGGKDQLPWDVVDILVNDLRKGVPRTHQQQETKKKDQDSSLPITVQLWPVPKNDVSVQVEADNHKNAVCQEEYGNFLLLGGGDNRSVAVSISSHSNDSIPGGETISREKEQQQKPISIEIKYSNNNQDNNESNNRNNNTTNRKMKEEGCCSGGSFDNHAMGLSTYEGLWKFHYKLLLDFKQKMGHTNVSQTYEDKKLAGWVKRQRRQYALMLRGKKSSLTQERIHQLESVGFVWDSHELLWREKIEFLKEFRQKHGHCNVGVNYKENKLGHWVKCQRRQFKLYKDGKLSSMDSNRVQQLDELGFEWKLRDRKKPGS